MHGCVGADEALAKAHLRKGQGNERRAQSVSETEDQACCYERGNGWKIGPGRLSLGHLCSSLPLVAGAGLAQADQPFLTPAFEDVLQCLCVVEN
jgi:hypothetical protein